MIDWKVGCGYGDFNAYLKSLHDVGLMDAFYLEDPIWMW